MRQRRGDHASSARRRWARKPLLRTRRPSPFWIGVVRPSAPMVMALSIPAVNRFDLADHGVAVTREVPTGLFSIGLPDIDWSDCGTLLTGALALGLRRLLRVAGRRTLHGGQARLRHRSEPRTDCAGHVVRHGGACRWLLRGRQPVEDLRGQLRRSGVADGVAPQRSPRLDDSAVPGQHLPEPAQCHVGGVVETARQFGAQSPLEHDVARAHGCSSLRCDSDSQSPLIACRAHGRERRLRKRPSHRHGRACRHGGPDDASAPQNVSLPAGGPVLECLVTRCPPASMAGTR